MRILFLKINYLINFYFLYSFKGYFPFTVITKYWLYSLCCIIHPWAYLTPNSLYLPLPNPHGAPFPLPTGNDWFVLYICESASFCYICQFVVFFRFHMQVMSYSILTRILSALTTVTLHQTVQHVPLLPQILRNSCFVCVTIASLNHRSSWIIILETS